MKHSSPVVFCAILLLAACGRPDAVPAAKQKEDARIASNGFDVPLSPDKQRSVDRGRVSGDDGWNIFGGSKDAKAAAGTGIGVNSFLWRASLDTLSFMPLASADPFGGTILTDWYEDPKTPGERFKVNALINDKALRADAIKVKLFKQHLENGQWRDMAVSEDSQRQLEDTILTRARELRVNNG